MTLNYFNGSQSSVVAEDVIHGSVDLATNRAIDQSHTAAVLAYAACPDPEKAAALTADDLEAIIESPESFRLSDIYKEICHFSVAVNGTACALDLNIRSIHLTEDSQTVYITTKNPDNSDIDLYQAGISGNSLQTPTQIASDIDDLQIIGNNVVFWQDSAVFVNNARIDDDVLADHVAFRDDGSFVYLVGEEDDNSYQLKSYKDGKITTIADDVFDFGFTTGGDLLYLRDYNLNRCVAPCTCTMARTAQSWTTMLPRSFPEKSLHMTVVARFDSSTPPKFLNPTITDPAQKQILSPAPVRSCRRGVSFPIRAWKIFLDEISSGCCSILQASV